MGKNLVFIDALLGQSIGPWFHALPGFASAIALLIMPGLLLGAALGLRPLWAASVAPALTAAIVAASTLMFWWLHVDWNIGVFCCAAFFIAGSVFGLRRLTGRRRLEYFARVPAEDVWGKGYWAALVVAAVLVAFRYVQIVERPTNPNQGMDAPFHYNLIQQIIDSGDASPFSSQKLMGEASGFYPQIWHALAALLAEFALLSPVEAANALNFAIVAIAWPLGVLFLVSFVVGRGVIALMFSAVACAGFFAFPFTLLQSQKVNWGPLFPYMFAVTLMPALFVLLAAILRFGKAAPMPRITAGGALVVGVVGLASTHMSALVAFVELSSIFVAMAAVRSFRALRQQQAEPYAYLRRGTLWLTVSVVGLLIWAFVRTRTGTWGSIDSLPAAVGSVILTAPTRGEVGWGLAILTVIGTVVLIRMPAARWFLSAYAVAIALYLVAAAVPDPFVRIFIIGAWYGDPPRLAALLPMFWAVLVGLAGAWLFSRIRLARNRSLLQVGLVMLAVSIILFPTNSETTPGRERNYSLTGSSPLLSLDEVKLLERLGNHVPEDAVLANNPWDGSSTAYAMAGRRVLFPHVYAGSNPDRLLAAEKLNQATPNSDVCAAAERENIQFLLDFGDRYIGLPEYRESNSFPGIQVPESSSAFIKIDQEGPAALYKFVGCDV